MGKLLTILTYDKGQLASQPMAAPLLSSRALRVAVFVALCSCFAAEQFNESLDYPQDPSPLVHPFHVQPDDWAGFEHTLLSEPTPPSLLQKGERTEPLGPHRVLQVPANAPLPSASRVADIVDEREGEKVAKPSHPAPPAQHIPSWRNNVHKLKPVVKPKEVTTPRPAHISKFSKHGAAGGRHEAAKAAKALNTLKKLMRPIEATHRGKKAKRAMKSLHHAMKKMNRRMKGKRGVKHKAKKAKKDMHKLHKAMKKMHIAGEKTLAEGAKSAIAGLKKAVKKEAKRAKKAVKKEKKDAKKAN